MSKRKSDRRSRYTGLWTPESCDEMIDKMIEIAGPLPEGRFPVYDRGASRDLEERLGSAREALHQALGIAHLEFMTIDRSDWAQRNQQRQADLRRIETVATELLRLTQGLDDYQFRLAAGDEASLMRESLSDFELMWMGHGSSMLSASGRLRIARAGVEALGRWAKIAAECHLQSAQKRTPDESSVVRHRGNVPLNRYIKAIVTLCWQDVWGHKVVDGPKLYSFVILAAQYVNVPLSRDGSRERIRRIFGMRRVKQAGVEGDLPI